MEANRRPSLFLLGIVTVVTGLLFSEATLQAQRSFVRGDVTDTGSINIIDAITLVRALFDPTGVPLPCQDAADVDDNGRLGLTDAIYLMNFALARGDAPPAPWPDCGRDPSPDDVRSCTAASWCLSPPLDPMFEKTAETNAFVFLVDRSASTLNAGEFVFAKQELGRRIQAMDESDEVAIVFFDDGILRFPDDGGTVRMDADGKSAALAFLQGVLSSRGTCPLPAFQASFDVLAESDAASKRIVYLGDGGATCRGANESVVLTQTLEFVTANVGQTTIHAAGLDVIGARQEMFLSGLAEATGGVFAIIDL